MLQLSPTGQTLARGSCCGALALILVGCPGVREAVDPAADLGGDGSLKFRDTRAVPVGDGPASPVDTAAVTDWAEADSTADGDAASGSTVLECQRVCSDRDDCCAQPPCDTYPFRYLCQEGYCRYLGCSGDQDCGGQQDVHCMEIDGVNVCAEACTVASDCSLPGEPCIDSTYCGSSRPATYPTCSATQPCPDQPNINHCYLPPGICGCLDNAACQAVMGSAGGTWRCAPQSLP